MTDVLEAPRADCSRSQTVSHAAVLFGKCGYERTSMRDIATAVGLLSGSVYYYFPSKDALFAAVYQDAIDQITVMIELAVQAHSNPWDKLQAAAAVHLQVLLSGGSIAAVLARSQADASNLPPELVRQRDRYEQVFRDLIDRLPLPQAVEPTSFRLALLDALNWTLTWYPPGHGSGRTPEEIAQSLFAVFRAGRG